MSQDRPPPKTKPPTAPPTSVKSGVVPPPPSSAASKAIPTPPPSIPPSSADIEDREPIRLRGIAGSPGVAVGPALVLGDIRASYVRRHIHTAQIDTELARVRTAVDTAKNTLKEVSAKITGPARDTVGILDAYLLMLDDPTLHDRVEKRIRKDKVNAEWAVADASEEISKLFAGNAESKDAYIVERRHDVEFVCDRLLRALVGDPVAAIPKLEEPMIIIARDLSPADTAGMVREPAIAFVTEIGTRTSHTAIMARALEIPAVVGAEGALDAIRTGDIVVVDGLRGEVIVHPGAAGLEEARGRAARHLAFARGLLSARDRPCVTADGTTVSLKANVELPAEAILAVDHGAEGIGLYRTEFLYIDRTTQPDEQEQYELYRAVLEAVSPKPVVLRTFDIGGDKFASSFQLPAEMNPALGLRAVRLALRVPEVFMTQLRAMVRASAHGDLRIMIPMVASVHEMREVRKMLGQATSDIRARGLPFREKIPLGMMVEVPAAAVMADVFAREAEFFSLGTNDLVQYALAIDRASRTLAALATPFDPAILRLIHNVARAGRDRGIPVSICGAMASDPLAACLLLGLGLRDFSMEAAAIPELKEAIRRVSIDECERAATEALACDSAEAVVEVCAREFAPRLMDLISGSADEPVTNARSSAPALD